MRRSKKFSLSDLPEVTTDIELVEEKTITYEGHEYTYRIEKYTMYKDYNAITVTGGPCKGSATTTCKRASIKKKLKGMILSLKHK